ncbi:MAG: DUF2075 domain-containing protein, partial [Actinobacteria bacterium]|nr:DUF2075 domain-containing protein [Actinomycetota bacterium]
EIFKQKECGLDSFIKFYSTRTNSGLAEGDPNKPHFEIVIYDEAQKMTKENIRMTMQRGDITVFFYDETQILNAEEEGFKENFIKTADDLKIPYEVMTLKGVYRVRGGSSYHKFIEDLLNGNPSVYKNSNEYELKLFENITELLEYLKEITRKSYKIALVASFTESPGDRKNKDARTIMNLRVGYPMYSDLEIYKGLYFNGLPLQVYWLMDERIQYPRFWLGDESNILTHCASVYGCQGFEADYVGVIWGRDLVWRNGSWKIGENCQDTIGKPSLKKLIERAREGDIKAEEKAIRLLKNRYRIFLTRGMLGTSIFCEDKETGQLLKKLLLKNK